jgi:hypothetical protein
MHRQPCGKIYFPFPKLFDSTTSPMRLVIARDLHVKSYKPATIGYRNHEACLFKTLFTASSYTKEGMLF